MYLTMRLTRHVLSITMLGGNDVLYSEQLSPKTLRINHADTLYTLAVLSYMTHQGK